MTDDGFIQGKLEQGYPCLNCGKLCDGFSGFNGHKPRLGDLSCCFYCGAFYEYGEGKFVPTTQERFDELSLEDKARILYMCKMRGLTFQVITAEKYAYKQN